MVKTASLALACLLLAGCGGSEPEASSATSATTATSTSTAPTPTPTAENARLEHAIAICTDRLTEPDTLVFDAIKAARAGTRSVSEIAEAFRQAQDALEGLATEAQGADLPRLSQSLQAYADVLGRARVSGDAGLPEMTDAREAVNTACLTQSAAVADG